MATNPYASTAKSVNRLQRAMNKSSSIVRRQYVEEKPIKLTFKQKLRKWLMNDSDELVRRQYVEEKPMKLTFKQKLRKWLMDDSDEYGTGVIAIDSEGPNIQSQGFRLNIYGAAGGTIIETTKYDRQKDDHRHSLHVVTDDKDLGEELAKIITMESLR